MSEIAIHSAPAGERALPALAQPAEPARSAAPSTADFVASLLDEIRADRGLYVLIALYFAATGLLAVAIGEGQDFHPFLYLGDGIQGAFGVLLPIVILVRAAVVGSARQPLKPLAGFATELVGVLRPRFMAGCLLFCAILVFYGSFTSVKNLLPDLFRFEWDTRLADIDRALHFGNDPAAVLSRDIGPGLTLAIDFVYSRVWFIVLLCVSTWAALSTRYSRLRVRFFMSLLLCWLLLGNVLAGAFLSAGPIYYDEVTHDQVRFAALGSSLGGTKAEVYAYYLWDLLQHKTIGLGTGISAFPSMHISICMLMMFYLWAVDRRLGVLAGLLTVVMLVGSVRLGWHYAIDGYASIILTPIVWGLVAWSLTKASGGPAAVSREDATQKS